MRHNVGIYDTGRFVSDRYYRTTRRNEAWLATYLVAGGVLAVLAIVMILVGLLDPAATIGVTYAGLSILSAPVINGLMFLTHRNFGLTTNGVIAQDAIYTLPKSERKQYKISREELNALGKRDAERLAEATNEYRRHRSSANGINRLYESLTDYNNTFKEIEG